MTLKEFLLDPSFVPPLVEYTVEETDGLHHARVAIGGTSHAGARPSLVKLPCVGLFALFASPGAPSSSREEAELSAALVALRSIRANSDEKRGHQDAGPAFKTPFLLLQRRHLRHSVAFLQLRARIAKMTACVSAATPWRRLCSSYWSLVSDGWRMTRTMTMRITTTMRITIFGFLMMKLLKSA